MTKSDPTDMEAEVERLRKKMENALRGFEKEPPPNFSEFSLRPHTPERRLFPVPELVLFGLRNIMGFPASGPWEKVRWTVYATVDGYPFGFAYQKFGFRVLARGDTPQPLIDRVSNQLSSSLKLLEPLLTKVAKTQIAIGNLTLENRMAMYTDRYEFFRKQADDAFAFEPEEIAPQADTPEGSIDFLHLAFGSINQKGESDAHGFFASSAMIDAWFSRLEHRLLLLRAFKGTPLKPGDFETFIAAKWDDRFKMLFERGVDKRTGELLGELRRVKEALRNPLAHGGIKNDGGSFYFHLPAVGAVPANLSRYRDRVEFSFFPIPAGTHEETCKLFDDVDALLTTGEFELPNEFVRWGLDPQFDAKSVARYGEAIAEGPETVEALVDHLSREWEQHANMDY
ncbi:hypothetical protein ABC955_09855 [Citromicrobium bathyomarinum]